MRSTSRLEAFGFSERVETPISLAAEVTKLAQSTKPLEQSAAELLRGFDDLRLSIAQQLAAIHQSVERQKLVPDPDGWKTDFDELVEILGIAAWAHELTPEATIRLCKEARSRRVSEAMSELFDSAKRSYDMRVAMLDDDA